MIQVAVVEDDAAQRDLYAELISRAPDMRLEWTAGSIAEAREQLQSGAPDVLLVDLGLPDGNGLGVIASVKQHYPACEVMVVSVFGDEENVVAAIEAGATGYLLKDALAEWFLNTIREVRGGGSPISPSIARILLSRARGRAGERAAPAAATGTLPMGGAAASGRLTSPAVSGAHAGAATHAGLYAEADAGELGERELEILSLVAKGFNSPEIGHLLSISTNTVKTHIYRIYRKLSVHSRGEAVFEAKKLGLLDF